MSCPKNKGDYKSEEAPEDEEQKMVVPTSEVVKSANGYKKGCKIGTFDWVDREEDIPEGKEAVYQVAEGPNAMEVMAEKVDRLLRESAELQQQLNAIQLKIDKLEKQSPIFARRVVSDYIVNVAQLIKELGEISIRRQLAEDSENIFDDSRVLTMNTVLARLKNDEMKKELLKDEATKKLLDISNSTGFKEFIVIRNDSAHPTVKLSDLDKVADELKTLPLSEDNQKKFEIADKWLRDMKSMPCFDELMAIYNAKNNTNNEQQEQQEQE